MTLDMKQKVTEVYSQLSSPNGYSLNWPSKRPVYNVAKVIKGSTKSLLIFQIENMNLEAKTALVAGYELCALVSGMSLWTLSLKQHNSALSLTGGGCLFCSMEIKRLWW